jgi:site-specific recombinase XerD
MEWLSAEELRALLTVAKAKRDRDWLMILVTFWHGLRANEVCGGWRVRKVNGQKEKFWHPGILPRDVCDGYLTVDRAKGSKTTVQALVSHADALFSERDPLMTLASQTLPKQRLFPVTRQHYWYLIKGYGRAAGIPEHRVFPHCLKHSIAHQMIDIAGIHKTRQRLGHESIASTGEYLKETDASVDAVVVGAVKLVPEVGAMIPKPIAPTSAASDAARRAWATRRARTATSEN